MNRQKSTPPRKVSLKSLVERKRAEADEVQRVKPPASLPEPFSTAIQEAINWIYAVINEERMTSEVLDPIDEGIQQLQVAREAAAQTEEFKRRDGPDAS